MPRYEPLNPQDHGRLRVRPRTGTDPHFVQIVASEFAAAAASSPILFTKNPESGSFYAGAMFGFKPSEPALKSAAERGGFEPLSLQREGFFISGERIVIDRDHPRFSDTEGELLFDESQESSVRLRQMQRVLGQLHAGIETTNAFVRALVEFKLIEPVNVSLAFDDGEKLTLQSLYTVSLDSLHALDDAAALRLFRAGHLQLAYIMAGSLHQIRTLAQLRNNRLSLDNHKRSS
jgi:hypothetical protein